MSQAIPMAQVRRANTEAGFHFFDPDACRFFGSRIPRTAIAGTGGIWFTTSEQRPDFGTGPSRRGYSVRRLNVDGSVTTIDACGYSLTWVDTLAHARRLATDLADGIACLPSQWIGSIPEEQR